ncbi:PGC-1 and ERR-induced regulator in muscle protein 1 [Cuculus canorus]|uniref:PGC-1 and ERR-induced regulator in muscle protein 1 n=1 Tax=Cuculus canorus TaxID=55661 RepID=UPI0023AACA2B|nr:PGC-1 and ERR-induced regulator in muscle protein 1 [Cuculus canorus]
MIFLRGSLKGSITSLDCGTGMDNFEYSIQLNDRDWAEFFLASEECNLAPATLATAEEQCLSDIEQGDGVPARDCHASTNGHIAARVGNGPGSGTGNSAPRGVPRDASLRWPIGGHLALPELLSGSEDEADVGSVSRFLCESDKPGCPSSTPMPSTQGRQPPCTPTAATAGGTGQDAACEAASQLASASEKGAASGRKAMEHPSHPAGTSTPEQGGDAGGEQPHRNPMVAQPMAPVQGSSPVLPSSAEGSARKSPSSVSRSEPGQQGPLRAHPPSPSLETAPRAPGCPAREEASVERAGAELSSPDVVRPKVPGQTRKSRKQRGASGAEAAQGDKEPAGAAAQGAVVPMKAPLSSPLTSRKSKGKEKAAKPAPVKLGSEEAGESKQPVPSPSTDKGDPAVSASPKLKVKEPAAQPLEKTKTTKHAKLGQAGGLGVRDNVPVIPASGAVSPLGETCQEVPEKPPCPKSVAVFGGDAAEGAHEEPAAQTPGELGPPCFAAGTSARADTLDVTWPEMYDYLFCDSQGEEEGMGNSVEGEKTPLEREISLPELYEYFFWEPEGKRKKVKGKDRKRKKFSSLDDAQLQNEDLNSAPVKDSLVISVPEVYEHFFPDGPRNRAGWRGIFSITPASEVKKAVGALKSLLQRPMSLVRGQAPAPQALVRRGSGDNLPLVPLAPLGRGQTQPGLDMTLALTGRPEVPLALTHKDMCLVFCAFASWAVKTSDLRAPDAWKTMFLASFGTLSAIRYFRRQVREGQPRI